MLQIYFIGSEEDFSELRLKSRFERADYRHFPLIETAILHFQKNPVSADSVGLILFSDVLDVEPEKACRALLGMPAVDHLPLLLMTAGGGEGSIERCLNAGAFDIIRKPLIERDLFCRFESTFRMRYLVMRRMHQEERLMNYRKLALGGPAEESGGIDALTGLFNSAYFDSYSEMEWSKSRFINGNFSILTIEVDGFSEYSHMYGNRVGDESLLRIVDVIRKNLKRPGDIAVRFHGARIVCVISETDLNGANIVAEKIRSGVNSMRIPFDRSDMDPHLTVSIGVASAPARKMETWHDVNEMSRLALEQALKRGDAVAH